MRINPIIINGEPVCSREDCPSAEIDCWIYFSDGCGCRSMPNGDGYYKAMTKWKSECLPGLRKQRDDAVGVHGAEAEALRVAFETLAMVDDDEIDGKKIMDILERVDAGEALALLEKHDEELAKLIRERDHLQDEWQAMYAGRECPQCGYHVMMNGERLMSGGLIVDPGRRALLLIRSMEAEIAQLRCRVDKLEKHRHDASSCCTNDVGDTGMSIKDDGGEDE